MNGQDITYVIKTSPRASHLRLEIRPGSGLTAIVPRHIPISRVKAFIKEKQMWVLAQLGKAGAIQTERQGNGLCHGEVLPYLGKKLTVCIEKTHEARHRVTLDGDTLRIGVINEPPSPRRLAEQWYRTQAKAVIEGKASKMAAEQQVCYNRIAVRGQRTLWGSCSRKRNLSFNWRLMMAPEAVLDYVITHELAHLTEMNHSKRFWSIVSQHCPQWRTQRRWLTEHSTELAGLLAGERR